MPLAGVLWALTFVAATAAGRRGEYGVALGALGAVAVALPLLARRATRAVLQLPTERRAATNLVATRGDGVPTVWLVAHLDSKSQPVPMAARVVGVGGAVLVHACAAEVAAAAMFGANMRATWTPLAVAAVLLALPVIASVIGSGSPGALDNASGVAAVLVAATDTLAGEPPLPPTCGVLLTSAEELGLAGARAWVDASRDAVGGAVALNVDGVDDEGPLRVMIASPLPAAIDGAIAADSAVRRLALPPGVLVDAIAFADAGVPALTISRGTWRTLGRIHTPRDGLARLRGDGVPDAARLLRRLAATAAADDSASLLDPTSVAG